MTARSNRGELSAPSHNDDNDYGDDDDDCEDEDKDEEKDDNER
jgi:hypothetical protein